MKRFFVAIIAAMTCFYLMRFVYRADAWKHIAWSWSMGVIPDILYFLAAGWTMLFLACMVIIFSFIVLSYLSHTDRRG